MRTHTPSPPFASRSVFLDGDRDAVAGHVRAQLCGPCLKFFPASSVTAGPVLVTSPTSSGGRRLPSGGAACALEVRGMQIIQRSADRGGTRSSPGRGLFRG
jgi:hypothetical protein